MAKVVSVDAVEVEKVARMLAALTANWGYVLLLVVRVVAWLSRHVIRCQCLCAVAVSCRIHRLWRRCLLCGKHSVLSASLHHGSGVSLL